MDHLKAMAVEEKLAGPTTRGVGESALGMDKPGLIVACLAPAPATAQGTSQHSSLAYLQAAWRACEKLGLDQPIRDLDVDRDFPEEGARIGREFQILAARQGDEGDSLYEAYVFSQHDVWGFVALFAPNRPGDASAWNQLEDRWTKGLDKAGAPALVPKELLGEVRIFTGLLPARFGRTEVDQVLAGDELARDILYQPKPPRLEKPARLSSGRLLAWGHWNEHATEERERHLRARLVLLGCCQPHAESAGNQPGPDEDVEAALDDVAWWSSTSQAPPLVRYLLQASKVHYQYRAYFERGGYRDELQRRRQAVELHVSRVLHQLRIDQNVVEHTEALNDRQLLEAVTATGAALANRRGLFTAVMDVRELAETVTVARRNCATICLML